MNKKIIAAIMFLMFAIVLQVSAYEDEAFSRKRWQRRSLLERKILSIGLIGAVKIKTEFLDSMGNVKKTVKENRKMFAGFSAKLFPFWGGKMGIGCDAIIVDWGSYEEVSGSDYGNYSRWQVDIDMLLRFRVGRKIILNGGLGWTSEVYKWESKYYNTEGKEWDAFGFNAKVGFEYFINSHFSITLDYKWTRVYSDNREDISIDTTRTHSIQIGGHFWL